MFLTYKIFYENNLTMVCDMIQSFVLSFQSKKIEPREFYEDRNLQQSRKQKKILIVLKNQVEMS